MKFKGCIKRAYDSQPAAKLALNLLVKKRETDVNPTYKCPRAEYYCDKCGKWHLTSASPARFEMLEKAKVKTEGIEEHLFINEEAERWQKRLNSKTSKETPKFKSGKGSPLYKHNRF